MNKNMIELYKLLILAENKLLVSNPLINSNVSVHKLLDHFEKSRWSSIYDKQLNKYKL